MSWRRTFRAERRRPGPAPSGRGVAPTRARGTACPDVEPAARASVRLRADLGYCAALGEKYDCVSCGACCFGKRDYVQVFAHDAATLGHARTAELVAPAVGEIPASVGRES